MTFQLTEEDIADANRYGLRNTLLYLICNRTGTLWRMTECGVGMEIMPPYRTLRICEEGASQWLQFRSSGLFLPCRLRVEISPFGARPKSASRALQRIKSQKVLPQSSEQVASDLVALAG